MRLKKKIFLAHIPILLFIIIEVLILLFGVKYFIEQGQLVTKTLEVIEKTGHLRAIIIDIETGERGFVITGDETFLEPYTKGLEQYNDTLKEVLILVSNKPSQTKQIKQIESLINEWIPIISSIVNARKNGKSLNEVAEIISKKNAKEYLDNIRQGINQFIITENSILEERERVFIDTLKLLLLVIIVVGIVSILITFLLARTIALKLLHQIGGDPIDIENITKQISKGNFDVQIDQNEPYTGILNSVIKMIESLKNNKSIIELHNEELKIVNETLEERVKQRTKDLETFVYTASHDIKEPIRTISSFTKLFAKRFGDNEDPKAQKYIHYIEEGCKYAQNMIDDLLSYSMSGSNIDVKTHNMREMIDVVIQNLNSKISETDCNIKIEGNDFELECDKIKIERVISNIISNSIKFRRKDSKPEIIIRFEKIEDRCIVSIKDNGIGIPEVSQQDVFVMFKRLYKDKDYDGTGMGLSICNKIIEAHEGKIWIDSKDNTGTTILFFLPKSLTKNYE